MGSLEAAVPAKRSPLLRASPASGNRGFFHRPRSRVARFLLSEKVDYFQWICSVAAFFFVVVLFQAFLPGSVVERSGGSEGGYGNRDLEFLKDIGELDFGEGIRFVPSKLVDRFAKVSVEENGKVLVSGRTARRVGMRRPQLALIVADLWPDASQLQTVSIAAALKEIGYDIQIYSFEDGPANDVWKALGMPVFILQSNMESKMAVDWLNYDGILVNSLEARPVLSCLLQEPFRSIPVIWAVHESFLAFRLSQYTTDGLVQLFNDWKQVFSRATAIVFPTHLFPLIYSSVDAGNFFVIPGSPGEAWAESIASHNGNALRLEMGFRSDDFLVVIVGSQFSYSGVLLEHALVLQALAPVFHEFSSGNSSHLKIAVLAANSTSKYKMALERIALNFGHPRQHMQLLFVNGDIHDILGCADLVIYGSFLEEQSFPPVMMQAMSLGKLVIAPDLGMIRKYVNDSVHGYLFPKEKIDKLTDILLQVISDGQLSFSAQVIASNGKQHARNLMASESIEGYALLMEKILKFPSEVLYPRPVREIPPRLREEWQWQLFENMTNTANINRNRKFLGIIDKLEEARNQTHVESYSNMTSKIDEAFSLIPWANEKITEMANARKRAEEEVLKDRTDQSHGIWEEVYRSVKRADRVKNELHERDERELERTGQPLCIYEPFFGEGTWPFLHNSSLYRGIGLSSKGRRPGADDIDASSRLTLLANSYYRDALGEYGAFFALANRIDRIHKNAWIGFQSWRVVARKVGLSRKAETTLVEAIQARRHGDTLYFWIRMDEDPRNPLQQDFWTFCDALNAGNCRFVVSEALRRMYGLRHDKDSLPPMPANGGSWSVMHSWALPTRSFLEFVMFSRMFVDALDAQMYDDHHQTGRCCLSLSKFAIELTGEHGHDALDCHNICSSALRPFQGTGWGDVASIWCPCLLRSFQGTGWGDVAFGAHVRSAHFKDRHCYSRLLELLVNVWAYHSGRRMIYLNPETGAMQEHHKLKSRRGRMWIKWFSFSTLKSMDEDLAEEMDLDQPDRRWLWPSTGEVFWQGIYERERNMRQQQKERKKQQSKDRIQRMKNRVRQKTLGKYIKPPPEAPDDLNTTRRL